MIGDEDESMRAPQAHRVLAAPIRAEWVTTAGHALHVKQCRHGEQGRETTLQQLPVVSSEPPTTPAVRGTVFLQLAIRPRNLDDQLLEVL